MKGWRSYLVHYENGLHKNDVMGLSSADPEQEERPRTPSNNWQMYTQLCALSYNIMFEVHYNFLWFPALIDFSINWPTANPPGLIKEGFKVSNSIYTQATLSGIFCLPRVGKQFKEEELLCQPWQEERDTCLWLLAITVPCWPCPCWVRFLLLVLQTEKCAYSLSYVSVCMCMCIYVMYLFLYMLYVYSTYTHIYICTYTMCVCVYMCMYMYRDRCMYTCMCMYE